MSRSRGAAREGRGRLAARLAVVVPVGMLGASVLGGSAAAALPSNCAQTGTTVTCTYTTAGTYTFSVPAGVSSLDVTAVGASGGTVPALALHGGPGASVKDTAVPGLSQAKR